MGKIVVVAPHPDDETLGCGGTLLRHIAEGDDVHWLIITHLHEDLGFSKDRVAEREKEIQQVADHYNLSSVVNLAFPTTRLDSIPMNDVVGGVGNVFHDIEPTTIYMPYRGDIHTDHAVVFDAVASCTKWFRYPSIRRVLAYETCSETDFTLDPDTNGFRPNVFVDITEHLDDKISIMQVYGSELGVHPFPRSESAIRALATLRGAAAGCEAAEAFMLLRERIA